jgi:hypothetical protein
MGRFATRGSLIVAAAVVFATLGHAQGGMGAGKVTTVSGRLVDTKCYSMMSVNVGMDHQTPHGEMKGCGALCARLGIPVGVLTAKKEVWLLVTPATDLADFVGKEARITGTAVYGGKSIRPDKIEVKGDDGSWTAVNITMPMPKM